MPHLPLSEARSMLPGKMSYYPSPYMDIHTNTLSLVCREASIHPSSTKYIRLRRYKDANSDG